MERKFKSLLKFNYTSIAIHGAAANGAATRGILIIFIIILNCYYISLTGEDNLKLQNAITANETKKSQKVKLLLGIINNNSTDIQKKFIDKLSKNLSHSGQLEIVEQNFDSPKTKKEVLELFKQGFPLVLFINMESKTIEWRLYDSTQAEMVKGKKYKSNSLDASIINFISQDIWKELNSEPTVFTTKIAYIKRLSSKPREHRCQICVADFDGSNEQVLIDLPTMYVELSFHPSTNEPRLLASEFTSDGVRLVMLDFHGNKKVILGGDKLVVGASLSEDGNKAAYKESGDIWKYTHNTKTGSGLHELLVKNKHKCSSVSLCPNDDIIYCSDNKIYRFNASTATSNKIIDNGLAPAYCIANEKIAYSKNINGTLQLMLFNEKTGKTEQLTFDKGHKSDSCFSPCGNYLIFCHQLDANPDAKSNALRNKSYNKRIETMAISTRKRYNITSDKQFCSFPAWSPIYAPVQE